MRKLVNQIPVCLVAIRLVLGPVLDVAAYTRQAGWIFILCLSVATLSDILDGIIARRLGVASNWLRRSDSLADLVFYLCAIDAVWILYPDLLRRSVLGIVAICIVEFLTHLISLYRFNRTAAAHTYSAKLWGLLLLAAFISVLGFSHSGVVWYIALVLGLVVQMEGLAIVLIARRPPIDVRSIFTVFCARKDISE